MLTLTCGTDILFDKLRPETGGGGGGGRGGGNGFEKHPLHYASFLGWDFMQSLSSFLLSSVVIQRLMA